MATRKSVRKKLPKSVRQSPFLESALKQVPVDLWLACLDVYGAAASHRMPVQNPETRFVVRVGDVGYVPRDNPLNRGVMAVRDFTNDPQLNPAMIARIMAFGHGISIARKDPQFAKFFEADRPERLEQGRDIPQLTLRMPDLYRRRRFRYLEIQENLGPTAVL